MVGVVVVEVVFVYPGVGQAMLDAVRARDIPVVQACALIFAATYILLNLTAEMIAKDPDVARTQWVVPSRFWDDLDKVLSLNPTVAPGDASMADQARALGISPQTSSPTRSH